MSRRNKVVRSMILSEEEQRYYRALLSWEPRDAEELARKRAVANGRPLAGQFRVLILGAKGCGKTALLTKFCKGEFASEDGQPADPEYECGGQRKIEIKDQTYMIDTLELSPSKLSEEGQYLEHAVAITEAVVLVYDVRSRDSFDLLRELYQRIEEALMLDNRRQYYGIALVGNKADIDETTTLSSKDRGRNVRSRRVVSEGEGYELARSFGRGRAARCLFRETSARTGENVETVFALLGAELLLMRRQQQRQDLFRRGEADDEEEDDACEMLRLEKQHHLTDDGKSPKTAAKWRRIWSRGRFRRASDSGAMGKGTDT